MGDFFQMIPLKTENTLAEESVLEWTIILRDMSSMRTPVFSPAKTVDTKFYFEGWYQRNNASSYYETTTSLKIILRKLPESTAHSCLRLQFSVSIHYSDGTLYKEHKSDSINLADFAEEICINENTKLYTSNGSQTAHSNRMSSNQLNFKCWMTFKGHIIPPTVYLRNNESLSELRKFTKNFEALYLSSELSDVSFQIGEKTLKSHKFVLAANSAVFKTMLEQDFQEAKTNVITLSDSEPDIFEGFLKFLYTGEVEDGSFSNIKQLYALADKYDVHALQQECFKVLTDSSLNVDQLYEVLQLAYQYSDDTLKETAKQLLPVTAKKEQ